MLLAAEISALGSDATFSGTRGSQIYTMNIPNILTWLRIALLPVIVVVFYLDANWARPLCAVIFIVAGITDWLDGYLARRMSLESQFGAFLDPVADKLLVMVALVLLVESSQSWVVTLPAVVIIGREITISALREWMAEIGQRSQVAVSSLGKIKTTMQIIALVVLLYKHPVPFLSIESYPIGVACLYAAAVLTIWSMVQYLMASFKVGIDNQS